MTARFLSLACLGLAFVFSACAGPSTVTFYDQELARYKKIAVLSAASPDLWHKLKGRRLTYDPFHLDASRVTYEISPARPNEIALLIPSGGRFGSHACFVTVTIDRSNGYIVSMDENFWP